MKKTLSCIFAMTLTLSSFATEQAPNVIYIDGEARMLLTEPMRGDTALYSQMMESLPKDRAILSINWDGYTSFWSIKQESLYLDSIRVRYHDDIEHWRYECLNENKMQSLFKGYSREKGALAKWFTGTLRVAHGNSIRYLQLVDGRNYEYETLLTIEKGQLAERKDYHNKVIEGYSFDYDDLKNKNLNLGDIMAMLQLHPEKYPELAHVDLILFTFKDVTMDSTGHITNCTVTAKCRGNNWEEHQGIAEDMKQAIMTVHPWKMIYLYGKYESYALDGYNIPYKPN